MASYGGKREGAGRTKGYMLTATQIGHELRSKLADGVKARWKEIERATYDLALGHYVEKTMPDGETTVIYKTSPDSTTLKYLHDQVMGKAKETIETENPKETQAINELAGKLNEVIKNVKSTRPAPKISA